MDVNEKRMMAKRVYARQLATSEPQNTVEDAPSVNQPAVPQSGRITNGLNSVNRGLASVVELPYDIMNHAPELINLRTGDHRMGTLDEMGAKSGGPIGNFFAGLGKDPLIDYMGRHSNIREGLYGSVSNPDPARKLDNFVGESVGSTIVPSAFLASKANAIASGASKAAGPVMSWLTKPYAGRAGAQIAQDVSSSVGAGGGAYIADDQEMGPIGSLLMTMLGGGLSNKAHGIMEGGARDLYAMRNIDLGDGVKAKASTVDDVGKIMSSVVTDKNAAMKNIDDTLAMTGEINMADPTLGPASGDVGLSMLDVMQRSKNPVPFAARDQQIRSSMADEVGKMSNPNADVTAPQVRSQSIIDDEMKRHQGGIDTLYQKQTSAEQGVRDLDQQADQIVAPVAARRGSEGRASRIINEQIGSDGGALDKMTTMRKGAIDAVDPTGTKMVNTDDLGKSILSLNDDLNNYRMDQTGLPADFMSRVDDMTKKLVTKQSKILDADGKPIVTSAEEGGKVSLKDIQDMRKPLPDAISRAEKSGNFDLAKKLKGLGENIDTFLRSQPDEAVQKAVGANDEYMQFFGKQQPTARAFRDLVQRNSASGTADPDNIAGMFLNSTKAAKDDLDKLREIVPDRVAFDNAEEMYFDAMLAKKDLNPANVRNFIADSQDVLPARLKTKYQNLVQEMMGNRKSKDSLLTNITDLKRSIREAEGTMRSAEGELRVGPFGKMTAQDPDRYMKNIMESDDRIKQLKIVKDKFKGDQKAIDGFEEAMVRYATSKISGTASSHASLRGEVDDVGRPVVFNRLTKLLDDNREAFSVIMSPEKMNDLTRIQKIMSRLGNLQRRATTGSDTIEKLSMSEKDALDLINAAVNVKFGLVGGGMINRVTREAAKLLFAGKRKINAENLLTQAVLNPKVAKVILEANPRTIEDGSFFNKLNSVMAVEQASESNDEEHKGVKKFTP